MEYKYLGKINTPTDVKKLNNEELGVLCSEIRDCIINTVSVNGGHLASSLGAVELTVALHRCFNAPEDTIIFDVGHQCYAHKLLTGRYDDFSTLRTENGISGFMRPQESDFDPFVTGHSSTSVSSAFGVCKANSLLNKDGFSVAVVGDGAMTGGMIYEAFNNVSKKDNRLIVILNDNKMSISKNTGSLAKHLSSMRTRRNYFKFKVGFEKFLVKIPLIGKPLRSFIFHLKMMIKNAIYNSNIFESLGFYYMGPIDGHDITKMSEMISIAKDLNRPVLIHIKTVKGKGYLPAEQNAGAFHGVSNFDIVTGDISKSGADFSSVFGRTLCKLAENDDKICAITAAMTNGTGLHEFSQRFKNRFFDVGIAEEHAVTFSASLAKCGLKPVLAVYSTFLQRGYDQIIHDAAIANLPLTLAIDRAGLVGSDGETHQGIFDVAFLSTIPGIKVYSPSDFNELVDILTKRLSSPSGLAAIRYPRGTEQKNKLEFESRDGFKIYGDSDIALVTYGGLTEEAVKCVEILKSYDIEVSIIQLIQLNPLPNNYISTLISYKNIFFFEEGILSGGVAEKTGLLLSENGYKGIYRSNAITDFVKHASVSAQRKKHCIDCEAMVSQIKEVKGIE